MTDEWIHSHYKLGFKEHVEKLTPSQKAFPHLLHEWLLKPEHQLVLVAGGPGSGKTYTVTQCLNHVDLSQLRMAYTARVAYKINGRTIHSAMQLDWREGSVLEGLFRELENESDPQKCIDKSQILLNEMKCTRNPEIVVIDEVGMVAHWLIYWIIRYFFQKSIPTLFIMMGDPNQLRPVKSEHNVFSVNLMDTKRINLLESARFTPSYDVIVKCLRQFVDMNDVSGMLSFITEHYPVVDHINSDILRKCTRAMAHKNATIETYNNFYLKYMVEGPRHRLWNKKKDKYVDVKPGCRIFVTQNGVSIALNGTPLIFVEYDSERDLVICRREESNDGTVTVSRNV
ncbi:hypothetical protein JTE90_007587, partial [Oedothorax gibbosus]